MNPLLFSSSGQFTEGTASRLGGSSEEMSARHHHLLGAVDEVPHERRGEMTREAALAHAEREGLTLVRSITNKTGFKNLQFYTGDPPHPYQLKIREEGHTSHIGSYTVPEEGALEYARIIGPAASAREAAEANPAMTRDEALEAVEREGWILLRARNSTGFKYVVHHKNYGPRPFGLRITQDGHLLHLGTFATAEEAALQYARLYGRREDPYLSHPHRESGAVAGQHRRERAVPTAAAAAAAVKADERLRCRRAELQDLQDLLADRLLSEEYYTAEVKRVLEKEAPELRAPDTGLSLLASLAMPLRLEKEPQAQTQASRKRNAPAAAAPSAVLEPDEAEARVARSSAREPLDVALLDQELVLERVGPGAAPGAGPGTGPGVGPGVGPGDYRSEHAGDSRRPADEAERMKRTRTGAEDVENWPPELLEDDGRRGTELAID